MMGRRYCWQARSVTACGGVSAARSIGPSMALNWKSGTSTHMDEQTPLLSLILNSFPCDLVLAPFAARGCLFVRENQVIPFEPKIAVLICSYVVRPRADLWSMNHSVLFLPHVVGSAISEERVIRTELLRVGRFFRVNPVRVIWIGERHAHMACGVVHQVANWVQAILRVRLKRSIVAECSSKNQPPSPY